MTSDVIMWVLGAICALWCLALSGFVAQLDGVQQADAIKLLHGALRAIVERSGELRREQAATEMSSDSQAIFP